MSAHRAMPEVGSRLRGELGKLPAFLRRDFLTAWSYRTAFVSDAVSLVFQAFLFYCVGALVDPGKLPTYGGSEVTYLEFAAVGIAVGAFVTLGLGRVATAVRQEQLAGTLESLLITPTSAATVQLGSMVYDLLYVPVRTAIFLAVVSLGFGLHLDPGGVLPSMVLIVAFIPFVWGIGIAAGGLVLTFKRGTGLVGVAAAVLTLGSGAYFPLEILPGWAASLAELNPLTVALEGMREALLGGSWGDIGGRLLVLLPASAITFAAGALVFKWALGRERRRGSLGLY